MAFGHKISPWWLSVFYCSVLNIFYEVIFLLLCNWSWFPETFAIKFSQYSCSLFCFCTKFEFTLWIMTIMSVQLWYFLVAINCKICQYEINRLLNLLIQNIAGLSIKWLLCEQSHWKIYDKTSKFKSDPQGPVLRVVTRFCSVDGRHPFWNFPIWLRACGPILVIIFITYHCAR